MVALVHGLGGFAASWGPTMEALAGRATVLALDLPGFGRSAKPRTRYGLGFFAQVVDRFLDALGVRQVGLVGHSLGAAVALTCALARPERVDRVAFVGALVPGFPYRLSPVYRALAIPALGEVLALCGCAAVYRAALARCFHRRRADEIEFLVNCDYAVRTGWGARAAYLSTVRAVRQDFHEQGAEYRRRLQALRMPMLLIHGRQDPVVPAAHCEAMMRDLPRAETRWVDACGHFPQLEHPEPVNGWLSRFLVARPAPR